MATDTPKATGWIPVVKRLRRRGRGLINRLLTRLGGTAEAKRRSLAADTQRILVVRVNKRLGNILFLTPMLHALHAGLPHAAIDVLIRDSDHKPLLDNLPGVAHVYLLPSSPRLFGLLGRLRGHRYDLVIDPSGNSIGNRLAMALVGGRQRLGFAGPGQWLRLTHAAGRPVSSHQAQRSLELLAGGIDGPAFGRWPHVLIDPRESARADAARQWAQAFGDDASGPAIGFFINATGAKRLDDDWWRSWLSALRARAGAVKVVQVQPPGAAVPLQPDLPGVQIAALDVLGAFLARLDAFVAADSGPMHLAAAAGTPTVGLFKTTSAAAYAPLGPDCTALEHDDLSPDNAARATAARLDLA